MIKLLVVTHLLSLPLTVVKEVLTHQEYHLKILHYCPWLKLLLQQIIIITSKLINYSCEWAL